MHTHRHLFERICTLENLLAAATDALRAKRQREAGFAFWMEFEHEICTLCDELCSGTYRHGAYRYFTIYEPKERIVAAAPFRDRVVHHAIVRVIEPIFERRYIEDSFACRRGKGTHAAMRRAGQFARRFPYVLKCDVRKYFPSIDHGVLLAQLARVIADERLLTLIRSILDTHADDVRQEWPAGGDLFDVQLRKRGLPIGNLTSQATAPKPSLESEPNGRSLPSATLEACAETSLRLSFAFFQIDFLLDGIGRSDRWGTSHAGTSSP